MGLQIARVGKKHEAHVMKKYAAPLTLGLSCIAYGLVVLCAFYFAAQAQGATNVCNIDCLMQKNGCAQSENRSTGPFGG